MPAASRRAAEGASYAVSMAMRSRPFAARRSGTVTGKVSARVAMSRSFPLGRCPENRDHRRKGREEIIRRLPAGGGDVVLDAFFRALDLGDEVLEVRLAVDEVDLVGVHHQERRVLVVVEVVVVSL